MTEPAPGPEGVPHGDEPGASTTQYDDGEGTIGLADRIGDGAPDTNQAKTEPMPPTPGHADPAGAQPHTDPPEVPELGSMNVGAANPQVATPVGTGVGSAPDAHLPQHTAGSGGPRPPAVGEVAARLANSAVETGPDGAGTAPSEDRPYVSRGDAASSAGSSGAGPEMPVSTTSGTAHRAPGLQGETPRGESVESDTQLGADRARPGDAPDRSDPQAAHGTHDPGDARGVPVPSHEAAAGTSEEQGVVHGVKDPAT